MKTGIVLLIAILSLTQISLAKGGRQGLGLQAGFGVPFVTQGGLTYYFSENVGLDLGYNMLDLTVGDAKAKLTMPEIVLKWHPFSGAFFLGAGAGQEKLEATATDAATSLQAKAEVTATTGIAKLGWMWGSGDGGLWFGMDAAYIVPSGGDVKITSPLPSTDQAYKDVEDAGKKFGKTSYMNLTFARLGFIF